MSLEKIIQLTFRFLLCISAYMPMFIMLVLKNIDNLLLCSILIIVFILIPILVVKIYISNPLKIEANYPMKLKNINRKESEIMNYISGYIISLISFNGDIFTGKGISIPNLLGVSLLFLVICSLYMKANMYDINPVISLFYDILDVKEENGTNATLLVDRNLEVVLERRTMVRIISPGIYLYTNDRKNKISTIKILILIVTMILALFIWNQQFKKMIVDTFIYLRSILKGI